MYVFEYVSMWVNMKEISKYLEIRRVMSMYLSMRRLDIYIFTYTLKGLRTAKLKIYIFKFLIKEIATNLTFIRSNVRTNLQKPTGPVNYM